MRICHRYTEYNFYTEPSTFRDKEYTSIYCTWDSAFVHRAGLELPFTTHLGTNWKLWQVYRELYTNAKDEGGGVCLAECTDNTHHGDICVYVYGDGIEKFIDIYMKHNKFFLNAATLCESPKLRCVEKRQDSDNVIYYKTMYTGTQLDKPTLFTYDYTTTQELTEDRTLTDTWYIRGHISHVWTHRMPYDMLIDYLPQAAKQDYYEYNLDSDSYPASDDFNRACAYLNEFHKPMPMWARELYTKSLPFDKQIISYKPTRHQRVQLDKAITVLKHHRCMIDRDRLVLCVSLPNDMLGYYLDAVIYISRECFDLGFEKLLGTIYEEYVHEYHACNDYTRKMQNVLIDKVASLMLEVYEMEEEDAPRPPSAGIVG